MPHSVNVLPGITIREMLSSTLRRVLSWDPYVKSVLSCLVKSALQMSFCCMLQEVGIRHLMSVLCQVSSVSLSMVLPVRLALPFLTDIEKKCGSMEKPVPRKA